MVDFLDVLWYDKVFVVEDYYFLCVYIVFSFFDVCVLLCGCFINVFLVWI